MKILLSPAKKMRQDPGYIPSCGLPLLLEEAKTLLKQLRTLSFDELQALWGCNDAIARENEGRLARMNPDRGLIPALLAYDGIAFQYMAPSVFTDAEFAYVQEHLRILSGFYGVLRPLDGVCPYRLEMQAKLAVGDCRDLYQFWGRKLYDAVRDEDGLFINLASREYSRCIEPYLTGRDRMITCVFAQQVRGKLVQRATLAKMARGSMVRHLAEHQASRPEDLQSFSALQFAFRPELSSENEYVFLQQEK